MLQALALLLLATQLCLADPLNGGITTGDVVGALFIIVAIVVVFVTAPTLSYLSYKRPGRQLNIAAWVLAIITKVACIALVMRWGGYAALQWGIMAAILPNISLYLLLLKAERSLTGRGFQLAIFIRSLLGISVAGTLLSLVTTRLLFLGNIHLYQVVSGVARLGITVWFVYQYLKLAPAKGVIYAPGPLHPFIWGVAIALGMFINTIVMLLLYIIKQESGISGFGNFNFSMPGETVFTVAFALLSGVLAYALFRQQAKRS